MAKDKRIDLRVDTEFLTSLKELNETLGTTTSTLLRTFVVRVNKNPKMVEKIRGWF